MRGAGVWGIWGLEDLITPLVGHTRTCPKGKSIIEREEKEQRKRTGETGGTVPGAGWE